MAHLDKFPRAGGRFDVVHFLKIFSTFLFAPAIWCGVHPAPIFAASRIARFLCS